MKEATMDAGEIRKAVRDKYGSLARQGGSCCGSGAACGGPDAAGIAGKRIGYTDEEMGAVPAGANLGLGCGNPTALASLKAGETVLDLGSGAGFDCFLASREVGPAGSVIGVDMTPEMIEKARGNARKGGYGNVEFRLGEIENLPVADGVVDAVISNCVINLSMDKRRVFEEAFRVLKPGGRLMISDLVLARPLPEKIRGSVAAYVGCIAGAMPVREYLAAVEAARFAEVRIAEETSFPPGCLDTDPLAMDLVRRLSLSPEEAALGLAAVRSVKVHGVKPAASK